MLKIPRESKSAMSTKPSALAQLCASESPRPACAASLRAALACHTGMATFAEAGVANKPH